MRMWARRTGDRIFSRLLGLDRPIAGYTVHRRIRVPMRDGIDLLADHYAPTTAEPAGTLLVRGPYGRGFPFSTAFTRLYAARGYHVVLQSVRGTFGSGGVFEPMLNEPADGADTVVWLRKQPWFTGSFATIGLSYLGFTQWALLRDPPPELAAAIITVELHDFGASSWGTGSFALNDFLSWSDLVSRQEDRGILRALGRITGSRRRLARAANALPMGRAGRELLGTGAPWYESWLEHPDHDDPFWQPYRFTDCLDRAQVPVLLVGGWQDLFLEQTIEQYTHLRKQGTEVALTIGPWTHAQIVTKALSTLTRGSLDWLDTHLSGGTRAPRRSPVRVFLTGHGWVDLAHWPPPAVQRVLYLRPAGALADTPPPPTAPPSEFRYDPAHPTPTIGGRLLSAEGGYRDDARLGKRDDVLSFTGDPLTADLYVLGNPVVELTHRSDNPHVDLFVRISEIDARGRSRNVSDGFRRLPPQRGSGTVTVELDAIAHRFRAGSRIRLLVAGGSHPRFARNLGAGEPPVTAQRIVPATHTVHHGSGGTSRLVLPASSSPPSGDAAADPGGSLG